MTECGSFHKLLDPCPSSVIQRGRCAIHAYNLTPNLTHIVIAPFLLSRPPPPFSCEFTPWRLRRFSTNKFQNAPWFPPFQIFTRQLVLLSSSETARFRGLLPFFIMYRDTLAKIPRVRFTEIKPSNMHFVFSKLKIPFDKPSPIHRSGRSHHREA